MNPTDQSNSAVSTPEPRRVLIAYLCIVASLWLGRWWTAAIRATWDDTERLSWLSGTALDLFVQPGWFTTVWVVSAGAVAVVARHRRLPWGSIVVGALAHAVALQVIPEVYSSWPDYHTALDAFEWAAPIWSPLLAWPLTLGAGRLLPSDFGERWAQLITETPQPDASGARPFPRVAVIALACVIPALWIGRWQASAFIDRLLQDTPAPGGPTSLPVTMLNVFYLDWFTTVAVVGAVFAMIIARNRGLRWMPILGAALVHLVVVSLTPTAYHDYPSRAVAEAVAYSAPIWSPLVAGLLMIVAVRLYRRVRPLDQSRRS